MRYDIFFAAARLIAAPTRAIIELKKIDLSINDARCLNRKWTYRFFVFANVSFLILACLDGTQIGLNPGLVLILALLSFSRCNEIILAFGMDGFDQLNIRKRKSTLAKIEKIRFLILSFIELIINFAIIHYCVKISSIKPAYDANLCSLFDALYFSVATITTTGYGDIYPISMLAKIICMHEILSGVTLLIFAFSIYGSIEAKNCRPSKYRFRRQTSPKNAL